MSTEVTARLLATRTYLAHPNYAQRLIHKFPAPLVEPGSASTGPGDLPGLFYESLYEVALLNPIKSQQNSLYLVMAYRHMLKVLRGKNTLKSSGVSEWDCQDPNRRKYYTQYLLEHELLQEDNDDDWYI